MMQMLFNRWMGLALAAGVFCGCSEKVEKEEKTAAVEEEIDPFSGEERVVEEQAVEEAEVNSSDEMVGNKLRMIMIPRIDFVDISFEEAFDFLRFRITEHDHTESDHAKRGMGFVIRRPKRVLESEISDVSGEDLLDGRQPALMIPELRLRNVSFAAALRYICLMTDMRCEVDGSLVFSPKAPNTAWDDVGSLLEEKGDTTVISQKLSQIRLPRVDFENTSIHEVIDFLRLRSAELDVTSIDAGRKGINFVLYIPKGMETPYIDKLQIRDPSFEEVLKEICSKTGMRYELDQYAVILIPKDLK